MVTMPGHQNIEPAAGGDAAGQPPRLDQTAATDLRARVALLAEIRSREATWPTVGWQRMGR